MRAKGEGATTALPRLLKARGKGNRAASVTSRAATESRVLTTASTSLMSVSARSPFSGNSRRPPGSLSLKGHKLVMTPCFRKGIFTLSISKGSKREPSKISLSVLWDVRSLGQEKARVPAGSVPLSVHMYLCKHRPINLQVLRKDSRE